MKIKHIQSRRRSKRWQCKQTRIKPEKRKLNQTYEDKTWLKEKGKQQRVRKTYENKAWIKTARQTDEDRVWLKQKMKQQMARQTDEDKAWIKQETRARQRAAQLDSCP